MSVTELLIESIEAAYENRKDPWQDSPFKQITLLSNDERGKWGEKYIFNLIKSLTDFNVKWEGDNNIGACGHGVWRSGRGAARRVQRR